MRPINATLLANLKQEEYIPAILLTIDVTGVGTFYLTTWSEQIYLNGITYVPRGMTFDSIRYGTASVVDSVNLRVDDVDRALYAAFADRGSEPFPSDIKLVVLNKVGDVLASSSIFIGNVSEWMYSPGVMKFRVASVLEQWASIPTSTYSGSCRWKVFKGTECKYTGGKLDCDRTYTQCKEYSNWNNFGGFRWLQSLVGKTVTPGQAPS